MPMRKAQDKPGKHCGTAKQWMRNFHKSSELSFFVLSVPVLAKHANIQGQRRHAQIIRDQMERCHKNKMRYCKQAHN